MAVTEKPAVDAMSTEDFESVQNMLAKYEKNAGCSGIHHAETRFAELAKEHGEFVEKTDKKYEELSRAVRDLTVSGASRAPDRRPSFDRRPADGDKRPRRQCGYCSRVGHSEDVCFKKHGYPKDSALCAFCNKPGHTDDVCFSKHGKPTSSTRPNDGKSGKPTTDPKPSGHAITAICEASLYEELVDSAKILLR